MIVPTWQKIQFLFVGLSLAFSLFGIDIANAKPIEFYVSPDGNNAHAGSKEQPFRTLPRAQLAVREQIAQGLHSSITVYLKGGTYELDQTLVFGVQDSGTDEHSIRYAALPNETVVISGGQKISNWQVQADGHWTSILFDVQAGKWFFRQLVVSDRRAVRARWPNVDGELHLQTVNADLNEFSFDKPLVEENLQGQNSELVIFQNWSVTRGRITHSNSYKLTTDTSMGWVGHGPATSASPGKTVFLEHARHFLDQPGEWFLDREAGVLHYLPQDRESNASSTNIVAPRLKQLLIITGTENSPVRNLHFEGIRFEHTDFALPQIGYNEIQAAHYGTKVNEPTFVQPVAIECTYTTDCSFHKCRLAHLNSSGIGFGVGCQKNRIQHCTVEDIGGNGIMIGWRGKGKLSDGDEGKLDADWQNPLDAPQDNTVAKCVIRRCGADSFGGTAIWTAFSKGTRILNNHIHELPYTGISVGYRWNTTTTTQSDCLVASNHIHDMMRKLADGGGIYTLGLQSGTVFRNNYIHDVHRSKFAHGGAPNNGFFVDEGSKGFLFEANVVHSTSGESVRFNQCQHEWHNWNSNYFGNDAAQSEAAQAIVNQVLKETPP